MADYHREKYIYKRMKNQKGWCNQVIGLKRKVDSWKRYMPNHTESTIWKDINNPQEKGYTLAQDELLSNAGRTCEFGNKKGKEPTPSRNHPSRKALDALFQVRAPWAGGALQSPSRMLEAVRREPARWLFQSAAWWTFRVFARRRWTTAARLTDST